MKELRVFLTNVKDEIGYIKLSMGNMEECLTEKDEKALLALIGDYEDTLLVIDAQIDVLMDAETAARIKAATPAVKVEVARILERQIIVQ